MCDFNTGLLFWKIWWGPDSEDKTQGLHRHDETGESEETNFQTLFRAKMCVETYAVILVDKTETILWNFKAVTNFDRISAGLTILKTAWGH